jgi:tetratricopeptide (TPR) repeat protein
MSPAKTQDNEPWKAVQALDDELRGIYGLGQDEQGQGYRDRLQRLCDFLRALDRGSVIPPDKASDFVNLRRGLDLKESASGAREDYLQQLEDLGEALQGLVPAADEKGRQCLQRWNSWSPRRGLPPDRQSYLDRALAALGAIPPGAAPPRWIANRLLEMANHLNAIEKVPSGASAGARKRIQEARKRWQGFIDGCAADWEWAWIQVQVRMARECMQDKPFHPQCHRRAETAKAALAEAIPRLERMGCNQAQAQGLYGSLAASCLLLDKSREVPPETRLSEIKRALVYARHAVSLEPERSRERLVLLEVLAALGDPEDIRVQAEIALDLDAGPETLRTVGESYWGRSATLHSRRVRRQLVREAARFFAKALDDVESASLDERLPLDQIEAHAWAHFWLGRFMGELGRFEIAAAHLETAFALGFKPVEARLELAWTCMLGRDRKHADRAFCEAIAEAQERWRGAVAGVADAAGEKRPLAELAFEGFLGWAFLWADWDPDRADDNARKAEALLPDVRIRRPDDRELRAALYEVRGRIALHAKYRESIELLEESIRLSPGSGAYCALGLAYLAQKPAAGDGMATALQKAREAYRRGRESDLRGRHRRELSALRCELRRRQA